MGAGNLEYRILGPLEVLRDGNRLVLGGRKERSVLALLLLKANRSVTSDELIDRLWPEKSPGRPQTALQGYVSALRKRIERDAGVPNELLTESAGYRLRLEPSALDSARFAALVEHGKESLARGRAQAAADDLAAALALWRGPVLAEFADEPWAVAERARLEELRLACIEERIDAHLALGRHAELIGELEALVAQEPMRERLRGQLMRALYRGGRQADALEVYQKTRKMLSDELGIDPSPELQAIDLAILQQDVSLTTPSVSGLPPTNVPTPPNALIGRTREISELEQLVTRNDVRLVTITGPGGVGKTRLALEVAVRLRGQFADGVWWISLQNLTDTRLILPTIAHAVGARGDLVTYLADRSSLLVTDNFEQVVEGAAEIATLLAACSRLTVLATSRGPLRISGEHQQSLSPLGPESAIELFSRRAHAVRPDVQIDVIGREICRRLDGLPLAIELAAAWVRALPLDRILQQLSNPLPLLVGGPRDAPVRHRTLTATIDWSHQALSDSARSLFRSMSVFAGGCTFDAAATVCRADLRVIGELLDNSLISLEGDRYVMLGTIRDYAREGLRSDGDTLDAHARHAAYYKGRLQEFPPGYLTPAQSSWSDALERDHENIRVAVEWSIAHEDARMSLSVVNNGYRFWRRRGYWMEGLALVRSALAQPAAAVATTERSHALEAVGHLSWLIGNLADARIASEEALRIQRSQKDDVSMAGTLTLLSGVYRDCGRYAEAIAGLEEALTLAPSVAPQRIDEIKGDLGMTLAYIGEFERARLLLEEVLSRRMRGTASHTGTAHQLGLLAYMQGEFDLSTKLFSQALEIFDPAQARDTPVVELRPRVLLSLALTTASQGGTRLAMALCAQGLDGARRIGDRNALARGLEIMGTLQAELGDYERAARLFGAADALLATLGAPSWPPLRVRSEAARAQMRSRLGEGTFAAAYGEGNSASLEAVMRDALDGRQTDSSSVLGTKGASREIDDR